jgi:DNA-binding NtrC family response regulator
MTEAVILLVDDEPGVRSVASIALQRAGYQVLAGCDAAEALHISRSTERIDVLVTDVQMGDGRMDGFELASLIATERPGITIVLMSGVPDTGRIAAEKGYRFLSKPFPLTGVVETVRQEILQIRRRPEGSIPSHRKAG